jgi:hypothetical protein
MIPATRDAPEPGADAMPRPSRTRPSLEALDPRVIPSAVLGAPPAFKGLEVAVARFTPVGPCRCLDVSPVFALNYGGSNDATVPALAGLLVANSHYPTDPSSPVFFGLAGRDDGGGDTTL